MIDALVERLTGEGEESDGGKEGGDIYNRGGGGSEREIQMKCPHPESHYNILTERWLGGKGARSVRISRIVF